MVHGAPDLNSVACGVRQTGGLAVGITASDFFDAAAGKRIQSRGGLSGVDCRRADSLSVVQVVCGREAEAKRLVAVVFVAED